MMAKFLTPLQGEWLEDDVQFKLIAPLIYQSDIAGQTFIIPAGFVTDFASVPRVPILYGLFGDRAHHESVPHDFIYQTHITTKALADKVFLEAMKARGKSRFVRFGMYWGVVLGGASSYKSGPSRYTQLNDKGVSQ
jgi:hypothetical protein